MAAPITHVALTVKIFDKFFKDKIRKDFFIGTLFPDIRYLKVIDRDKTHFDDFKITDLKNDDSFSAGVKFHSILDIAREKFIIANDVYSLCPKLKYVTESLKILEDEIFYQHVKNWNEYIGYLNKILPNETDFGIAEKDIQKWHTLLRQYFQKQPGEQAITNFMLNIGFPSEVVRETNKNVVKMKTDKKIINILKKLYKNFDTLMT